MARLAAIFTMEEDGIYGGGVPVIICKSRKVMETDVMDMCRIIGATPHQIGKHIFVVQR